MKSDDDWSRYHFDTILIRSNNDNNDDNNNFNNC